MKKTLKLMVFTIFVLSITVLTLGSCDFDISGILGEYVCVHEWSEWDIVEQGDCKTPGLIQRECLNCGAIDEETTALKEHIEGEWVVDKEATCIEDGSKHTECTVCGTTISTEKILSAGVHSESDWIVDKEATCTKDGSKHIECTVCGMTISTETILSTPEGHKYENYNCVACGLTSEECFEFTYLSKSDSYAIKSIYMNGLLNAVSLPNSFNGKPVTSIGDSAFSSCYSLVSVTIPDSVTSIGNRAFYNCSSLTNITIPDSITSIGDSAFYDCSSLTNIIVGENNQYYKSIDGNLYSNDGKTLIQYAIGKKDTSFEIPNSVTSIGDYAFAYCSSLTSINIPDSVTYIGYDAFYDCSSLVSVTIPDSVTSIGSEAFRGCYSLVSVTIPDSVTSIGDYAFFDCSSLESVTIPDSVTSIGYHAFVSCARLTSIIVDENNKYYKSIDGNLYSKDGKTLVQYAIGKEDTSFEIPDSVTSIGYGAFAFYDSLESVVIGDSVTSIGYSAFWNCDSLKSVVIGDSVTYIGYESFYYCDSLTEVYYNGSAAEWNSISIGSYNDYLENATRYYYSETEPTTEGNFWHWGENGEIVVWE